jgi:adenylate cyclase
MRKTQWVSLLLAISIAAAIAVLEQRRGVYFLAPRGAATAATVDSKSPLSLDRKLAFGMHRLELATYDWRFKLRGDRKPHPDIAIVAITADSLKALKLWPWPRSIHARLIKTLAHAAPKALLFDIFFIEPYNADLAGDKELAQLSKKYPWVVHSFYYEPAEGPIRNLVLPYPSLLEATEHIGYSNAVIDEDGTLRRAVPQRTVEDQTLHFLSLVGAGMYLNKTPDEVLSAAPLDSRGRLLVHFTGQEYSYPYIPYHDLLSGKANAKDLAGKIVLVGSSATGTFDHYPTPLSRFMPGVEFHANVIDNLLRMNLMRQLGLTVTYAMIAFFALFCGVIIARFSAGTGAIFALGSAVVYGCVGQWLFVRRNLSIDMAGPLLVLGLGYMAILIYRFFTEEREKRMVKGFFSQQVSKELLDVLMANPEILKKDGERREMTALFSDVAGFTSISERLEVEELVVLLNRYLTAMTDVIFEYGGYVDKYMGDGIMAFWNGLLKQPLHAEMACRCALKSKQQLKELNIELERIGLVPLKARIGINTGPMAAGYMGSSQKKQYTIMGDNVNLASRLEGANKAFGTEIMISEFTCDAVSEIFEMRFLDIIRVPGKAKPVKTYELLGEKGAVDPVWNTILPVYHAAIQEFGSQQFDSAKRKFLEVLKILGHDKPCETYIQRVDAFLINPPPKDWDGVFELKTK